MVTSDCSRDSSTVTDSECTTMVAMGMIVNSMAIVVVSRHTELEYS